MPGVPTPRRPGCPVALRFLGHRSPPLWPSGGPGCVGVDLWLRVLGKPCGPAGRAWGSPCVLGVAPLEAKASETKSLNGFLSQSAG